MEVILGGDDSSDTKLSDTGITSTVDESSNDSKLLSTADESVSDVVKKGFFKILIIHALHVSFWMFSSCSTLFF